MNRVGRWRGLLVAGVLLLATGCAIHDEIPVQRVGSEPAINATGTPATAEPSETAATDAPSARPSRTTASSPPISPTSPRAVYLVECLDDNLVQRPRSFTLACGDSNEGLDGMKWSSWGGSSARATGLMTANDCVPTCAEGKTVQWQVSVEATGLVGHTYRTLVVTATGPIPPWAQRRTTYPLRG